MRTNSKLCPAIYGINMFEKHTPVNQTNMIDSEQVFFRRDK
jgi:hypothetical protein